MTEEYKKWLNGYTPRPEHIGDILAIKRQMIKDSKAVRTYRISEDHISPSEEERALRGEALLQIIDFCEKNGGHDWVTDTDFTQYTDVDGRKVLRFPKVCLWCTSSWYEVAEETK